MVALSAAAVSAQDEDPTLAATVSAVAGKVEKKALDGETKLLGGGDQVFYDENLTIPTDGDIWLTLKEKRGAVHLAAGSSAHFLPVEVAGQLVSLQLLVEKGQATLIMRAGDDRRLVVSTGVDGGYAVVRGGAATAEVSDAGAFITAQSGEVLVFKVAVPKGGPLGADGTPLNPSAMTLPPGERVAVANLAKSQSAATVAGEGLYAMGLRTADAWVERAEQGDFTPQRVEARGGGESFVGQTSTEFSFDQARPPVAVTTRAVSTIVTNVRANPAEALVASRVPASVVVGQKVFRTRITGSPGTGGSGISANPNVRTLIDIGG